MGVKYVPYSEYEVSGINWLGAIPSHWTCIRLKYVADIEGEKAEFNSQVEYVGMENVESWNGKYLRTNGVKPEGLSALFNRGDVLFGKLRPYLAKSWLAEFSGQCSSEFLVLKSRGISSKFLNYYSLTEEFVNQVNSSTYGSKMPRASWEFISVMVVPVPPVDHSRKIAKFLDHETAKIDTLIAKQQQLIQLLKEKRQAVISHAVTKGLNPDAPMRDSGVEWLGEVPAHWDVTKLGQLAFMQEGPGLRIWQFKDKGTRVICVTNITEDGINFARLEKFISNDEYIQSYQHFTVNTNDILLSSSGNSWGKVAVYEGQEKVILNTSTIRLSELQHGSLSSEYIKNFLLSEACREQLGVSMTGSCQPNFGPTHLKEVKTPTPPRAEQVEINAYIAQKLYDFDQPLRACEDAILLMQERRTALISAAVTGKIDVRNWVSPDASNTPNTSDSTATTNSDAAA